MKIDKLYSLSQFVDLMNEQYEEEKNKQPAFWFQSLRCIAEHHDLIIKYNEFLKQPLKREMFTNPKEYPIDIYYRPDEGCQKHPQECYESDMEEWQQHEKKVIFKQLLTQDYLNDYLKVHTIGQLSEKCTIELQNVEI
jgi:hypothetical protein